MKIEPTPKCPEPIDLTKLSPKKGLKHKGDQIAEKKRKNYLQQQGVVTTAEFTSYGNHEYTGIFEGAKNVIVRLTESDAVNNESAPNNFGKL